MADLYSLVSSLESTGVFQYLLPFLLVFTVIFAILEKTALFGTDGEKNTKTGINAVVGAILGLLVITQWQVVEKMNLFLPKMSLMVIIFVMILILIGIMGVDVAKGPRGIFALLLGIGAIVGIYWSLGSEFDLRMPNWVLDNQGTITLVAIILLVMYVITKSKNKDPNGKDAFDKMHKFFGLGGN